MSKKVKRYISAKLLKMAEHFKVVAITGPRQSGKTTLVKELFKNYTYISLENPDTRYYAEEDPRGFLKQYTAPVIFDEIQRVPKLLSYIQEIVDLSSTKGQYILTGSNNFLLQEQISQSLSGRAAYVPLLPFSVNEISNIQTSDNWKILNGFYPAIYDQQIPGPIWSLQYIKTYIERDVRQIKNITDLITFQKFMKILAGRCAQELNLSSISIEVGVDQKTIQSWIGILEASYIIYLLKPYHENFNKTVIKRPKVYFYDTAIICSLLSIQKEEDIQLHPFRGALFENMVVMDLLKNATYKTIEQTLFYWREKSGHEVDVIIQMGNVIHPVEIKSGQTIQQEYFKNIVYWNRLSNINEGTILYAGIEKQQRSNGITVVNWKER